MTPSIFSGVGMPDSGAMYPVPAGTPRPMRVRWDDVSAWSAAPPGSMPSDDGRTWLLLWLRGHSRMVWFGTKEAFFPDEESL